MSRLSVSILAGTMLAGSIVAIAQAQSSSPFARKKPKAWEQAQQPAPTPTPTQSRTYPAPTPQPYTQPQTAGSQPYSGTQTYTRPTPTQAPATSYQAPAYQAPAPAARTYPPAPAARTYQGAPYRPSTGGTASGGTYYPGKSPTQYNSNQSYDPNQSGGRNITTTTTGTTAAPQTYTTYKYEQAAPTTNQYQNPQYQNPPSQYNGAQYRRSAQSGQQYKGTQASDLRGANKPSWSSRLGLGQIETDISGRTTAGIAALKDTVGDWGTAFIGDIDVRGEVTTMTEGGLEFGAGARARAQYDNGRNGFGGRVGDCPTTNPACNSVEIDGVARPVKGHTGQFYTAGNPDIKEGKIALEGAYLFLRSSYGDVVVGRDDGAAYLFSLGAPSLVSISASNSRLDYTGLDSVKTYNDASGFSEKVSYTTPRLLGDQIGVGLQVGVSYALDATACGVDYCVRKNTTNPLDPFAPEIKDVIEVGVALDRKFNNGFSAELTGTYAQGSDKTGNVLFDNLQSYSAGLELKYGNLVFGTSYLNSNNGFAGDGDYTAYDVGMTWQPSALGFSASYGHADDDIANLTSDQGVFGVNYDIDGKFGTYRLGTGVQYIKRTVPALNGVVVENQSEDALALFFEAGVRF